MTWTAFTHPDTAFEYAPASLTKAWKRLHAGDVEPFPKAQQERQPDDPAGYYWHAYALDQAIALCEQAAASQPHDAMERLDIELARTELQD